MAMKKILNKIHNRIIKMRLQPIRVFCFHQVSEKFDASTMWECDWTQIEQFKHNIIQLKAQYTFISLEEAVGKLKNDIVRSKKYLVLTADDGWQSLQNIVPWLAEQHIPITLFVNPAYLKGEEVREKGKKLLTADELKLMLNTYDTITIASHGWNHTLCTDMQDEEFEKNAVRSHDFLRQYDQYIPFLAYPCGRYKNSQNAILWRNGMTPVFMDGEKNYTDSTMVHRELLDGLSL